MVHLMGLSKAGWVFCGIAFHSFNYATVHMVCNINGFICHYPFHVQGTTPGALSICEVMLQLQGKQSILYIISIFVMSWQVCVPVCVCVVCVCGWVSTCVCEVHGQLMSKVVEWST